MKICIKIITFLIFISFILCRGQQKSLLGSDSEKKLFTHSLESSSYTNDSVAVFNKYKLIIANATENLTDDENIITTHFKRYITPTALKGITFNESKNNIYIEFTLNHKKEPINILTNSVDNKKLDKKLKRAFKKLDFEKIKLTNIDPLYKYTLIVIQLEGNSPIIKCNLTAIGYSPPIFDLCKNEYNYHSLNACNYLYISEYIYNHIDLSYTTSEDIDNFNKIYPKFIIDKEGKVIAAKISSENKELIESYYKAILRLPAATQPAKLNGKDFYYGYNFPTSIVNIIRNNDSFNKFYRYKKSSGKPIKEIMKDYIRFLEKKRRKKQIEKVGF